MASTRARSRNTLAPPPPRQVNVKEFAESRAAELEALHSIISTRVSNDFRTRRSKRRRTASFQNRSKRRKLGQITKDHISNPVQIDGDNKGGKGICSRRIRRRMEFKGNTVSGFGCTGDGTKRLRTHLWHAKRFAMIKRWGFYVPLGLQGRGEGSRAILKWLKNGTLIHDASYCIPVQLDGPEDSLLAILKMVLVPCPSAVSGESFQSVISGVCHGSAMLFHVGAPASQPIGPVTYIWQPFCGDHIDMNADNDAIANGNIMLEKPECSTSSRRLWVLIHAAALSEGYDALRFACQRQMHENGILVNCSSLEGQLGKLEVMGSKALQTLKKLLHPISRLCTTSIDPKLSKCLNIKDASNLQISKTFALEHAEHLPTHASLLLTVHDPRSFPMEESGCNTDASSKTLESAVPQENGFKGITALNSLDPNQSIEALSSIWLGNNSCFCADNKSIWDSSERMNRPMEENQLCAEKHLRRLAFFCSDKTNSGAGSIECKEAFAKSCPILLLKNDDQRSSFLGWSIILPLSWVKVFWIPLLSHGARAIGLRERRWIACDTGLPTFPFDFPDCKAYSCYMDIEAASSDQAAHLRPLAMRPLTVPIPPPWDCARLAIEDKTLTGTSSESPASSGKCDLSSLEQNGFSSFQGFIARTGDMLSNHLNKIHGDHLLLYHNNIEGKNNFSELMSRGRLSWRQKGVTNLPVDRKLCFVRVLLYAHKEGVFEEGAVICAPTLTDISLWSSSLEANEQKGLQIPPELLRSYFVQQPSGNWEMQIPGDPATRQFHRWPIGFVTTGFVRGSSKPVAEGFCEVTLLAKLREEQWKEMQEKGKPYIFVLVRNLRSSAYRLGQATIALEKQKEDVEFMGTSRYIHSENARGQLSKLHFGFGLTIAPENRAQDEEDPICNPS